MTDQPHLNAGKEWSKKDLFSLRNRIEHGRTVAHGAAFLMRTETEVREKAAELQVRERRLLVRGAVCQQSWPQTARYRSWA
jgi:hypothetical protein